MLIHHMRSQGSNDIISIVSRLRRNMIERRTIWSSIAIIVVSNIDDDLTMKRDARVELIWFEIGTWSHATESSFFGEGVKEGPRLLGIRDWLGASILHSDGFITSYFLLILASVILWYLAWVLRHEWRKNLILICSETDELDNKVTYHVVCVLRRAQSHNT